MKGENKKRKEQERKEKQEQKEKRRSVLLHGVTPSSLQGNWMRPSASATEAAKVGLSLALSRL